MASPILPKRGRSPEAVVPSCHIHRPRGLVGHETGVPWGMKTGLIVTIGSQSGLPEIFVAGISLLNEHWYLMVITVIIIVATATLIELLCIPSPDSPELLAFCRRVLHAVLITTPRGRSYTAPCLQRRELQRHGYRPDPSSCGWTEQCRI